MEDVLLKRSRYIILSILLFVVLFSPNVNAGPVGFGRIDIESNCPSNICPFFDNPDGVWVFSWTDTGFESDRVRATWTDRDLSREVDGETDQSFEISIDGTENSCNYDIRREADRLNIKTTDIIDRHEELRWQNAEEIIERGREIANEMGCGDDDLDSTVIRGYNGFINDDVWVYCTEERDELGKIGSLQNEFIETITDWTVHAEGERNQVATISNSDSGEGRTSRIGDNVLVQWQGILSSGESCPLTSEVLMAHSTRFDGNWRVIDRSNHLVYEIFMRGNIDTGLIVPVFCQEVANQDRRLDNCGGISRDEAESRMNNLASSAISEREFGNVEITDRSIGSGKLKVSLERQIAFPLFRVFVDSDYLSLVIPTGVPEISCPATVRFQEGDRGEIEVIAENVGEAEGGFNIRVASCTEGFAPGDTEGLRLERDESRRVTLTTTAEVPPGGRNTGSCIIEMKETITQEVDTCRVNLEATGPRECTIGRIWCSFEDGVHVIKECPAGTPQILESCMEDEICDIDGQGEPFCKFVEQEDDGGSSCDGFLGGILCSIKDLFAGTLDFLKTIKLIIVVGISSISVFITRDVFGRVRGLSRKPLASWIIALVIGVGIGFALWQFIGSFLFWVASIIVVLYFLFAPRIGPRIRRVRGIR